RGLVGDARVLFLDEPTTGMDPIAAREFRALIGELRSEGRTILLATHDMPEAETLCDRVTLIDRGRIIATESPRSLSLMMSRFHRVDAEGVPASVIDAVGALAGVSKVDRDNGAVRIHIDREETLPEVLRLLVAAGVTSVNTSLPSLEEVYLG